jgi:hypothetical protein
MSRHVFIAAVITGVVGLAALTAQSAALAKSKSHGYPHGYTYQHVRAHSTHVRGGTGTTGVKGYTRKHARR